MVIYALVVVLGFQIHKVEGLGFPRYTVPDIEYIPNFVPMCFKFCLNFILGNRVMQVT
jgi:hypothetical protein